MVKHILATAVELNIKAACRAVVVTALNSDELRWWQRFGFEPFDANECRNAGSLRADQRRPDPGAGVRSPGWDANPRTGPVSTVPTSESASTYKRRSNDLAIEVPLAA
ncbi:hypothetical protein [Mycobacterium simulans]|uniref:hypothetical protein n=1 Tax=Mycobacterium simulans TaxID=627089 RepID=UPI0037C6D558